MVTWLVFITQDWFSFEQSASPITNISRQRWVHFSYSSSYL